MTTTARNKPKQSQKSGIISAQDILNLHDTVFKNGMLRKKGTKFNLGKWPHRLVVLTFDSIYVFDDEAAKSQNSKFHLCGYNKIVRCEVKGQQHCFSIVPAENISSITPKTFACVSDNERKQWMTAIKDQMYAANQIPKPSRTFSDKFNSISITDVDEYKELESLVYSTDSAMNSRLSSLFNDDDDFDNDNFDDDDNSSAGSQVNKVADNQRLSKMQDLNEKKRTPSRDEEPRVYDSVDDDFSCHPSVKSPTQAGTRQPFLRASSSTKSADSSEPPRYSAVVGSDDDSATHWDDNTEYANTSVFKPSDEYTIMKTLESMCTVVDPNLDRDQLIKMLAVKEPGTYLIRKSRQGDHKVISILGTNRQVKEYKIFGTVDSPSLDQNRFFSSIDDLLRYYTLVETLPNLAVNLVKGIYH